MPIASGRITPAVNLLSFMDIFDTDKRSDIMKRIKSKNSKSELLVFRYLRRRGIYFQKHYKRAPGSPDIALPRKKRAVFIDGDFWHGRTIDKIMQKDDINPYWIEKLHKNMERDKRQEKELLDNGWEILRIWDSDLRRKRTAPEHLEKIADFLLKPLPDEF